MTATIGIEDKSDIRRFYLATADLKGYRINQLKRMQEPNSDLVLEYLNSRMRDGHLKPTSRASTIDRLSRLSIFHNNKSFRELTEDIYSHLDTMRRTESEDPMHKWIGTFNLSAIKIIAFFKWLYEPDVNSQSRTV